MFLSKLFLSKVFHNNVLLNKVFFSKSLSSFNTKQSSEDYGIKLTIKNKQGGSALMMAIFIIIVMSLLGVALVNMLDSSEENVAFEVLGTRAYTAAQSGLQWQLSQIFPLNSTVALACQNQATIDLNAPTFNNVNGLSQCTIQNITCSDYAHQGVTYYTITSTGTCDIDNEVTSRTLQVEARTM